MKIKVGVMGSSSEAGGGAGNVLSDKADLLARAIAARDVILFTGATTGVVYDVGRKAHTAGAFHVGISPAGNESEHVENYKLPTEACDVLIYTGFGLKGRNVVLVRSCDIVLFIAGAMGSLNEFTIAHDEGKVIGCLTNTGGVADEVEYLLEKFSKPTGAQVFLHDDPQHLLSVCLDSLNP
ncbi:MAG: hypothetical protein M3R68_11100 [Acidobacteriota bacterium]|nr:hypothetical protein [Acidobacteriota bacterium]